MKKLYCAVLLVSGGDGKSEYIKARISSGCTVYGVTGMSITSAKVSSDPAKLNAKVSKLRRQFERLGEVRIRELTASELKELEESRASDKRWRDYEDRRANVGIRLSDDGEVVTLWFKKNLNNADRALMEILSRAGVTAHRNQHGYTYSKIKRPGGGR